MNEWHLNQIVRKMASNFKKNSSSYHTRGGSFLLLIIYAFPIVASLGGGGPWRDGAKSFATCLSTIFSLWGQATMKSSRIPHHMHLLVPTRHLGVVWLVLLHFP